MKIAVDLDATITAYPGVFEVLTAAMAKAGCRVYVVTDRIPGSEEQVIRMLEELRISYHDLKITRDKKQFILEEGIDVLFDDTDEYFVELPEHVAVFKVREHYNFDFKQSKWLYTEKTGRKV
ncbi:MAG: hypothetical protein FVQ82_08340 [Planctomycetes bacterium]|nr:hypothetical protein [Planctomycetota bacterium]